MEGCWLNQTVIKLELKGKLDHSSEKRSFLLRKEGGWLVYCINLVILGTKDWYNTKNIYS